MHQSYFLFCSRLLPRIVPAVGRSETVYVQIYPLPLQRYDLTSIQGRQLRALRR